MTTEEARGIRLHSQQLLDPQFARPEDVVGWLGMMQAQDYSQFRWAIGMRLKEPKMETVKDSFSSGRIVRLHLLRCTVQTVTAEDYPWLLELCRDRNLCTIQSWPSYKRADFSETYYKETTDALREMLANGRSMTKKRIGEELARLGMPGDNDHVHQVLLRGEIEGLLYSGEMQGRNATWTLARHTAVCPPLSHNEALRVLARKYFRSHSPAGFEDFCWWTGLPVTQNRMAMQHMASELEEVKVNNQTMYVHKDAVPHESANMKTVHLLPSYDEYLIGYKSRCP